MSIRNHFILICTLTFFTAPVDANGTSSLEERLSCKTIDYFTTSNDDKFKRDYGRGNYFEIMRTGNELALSIFSEHSELVSKEFYLIELDTGFAVFGNIRNEPDDSQWLEIRNAPEEGANHRTALLNFRLSNTHTSWLLACEEI